MSPAEGDHPDSEELERFMLGGLPRSAVAVIVRHMVTGCPRCVEVTRGLWSLTDREPHGLLVLVGGGETALLATAGDGRRRGAL